MGTITRQGRSGIQRGKGSHLLPVPSGQPGWRWAGVFLLLWLTACFSGTTGLSAKTPLVEVSPSLFSTQPQPGLSVTPARAPTASLPATLLPATPAPTSKSSLCIGLPLRPDLIPWFNQVARPEDVAAVDARHVALLAEVTQGRRLVRFASAAEALDTLADLQGQADLIGYDLEHWPQTPAEEQADPVGALQRLSQAAHAAGLAVSVGPDRRFTQAYGPALAPWADRFVIQAQRFQDDPAGLQAFLEPLVRGLQTANPDL